jgi:glycosyl-4,4'-diaponeurosporenoate acyltransferase
LPEAGSFFPGGFPKRTLGDRGSPHLERFVVETRRAELTHWVVLAAGPVFFLWNPWWLAVVMVVYALVANLPCIFVQRYNRARLERVLAYRARREPNAR